MNQGADGIFIDAIPQTKSPDPPLLRCYGDQLGTPAEFRHEHIFPYTLSDDDSTASNKQKNAFELLLKKIRKVVTNANGTMLGNTGLVLDNSTNDGEHYNWTNPDLFIQQQVLPYLDADMMEGFLDLRNDVNGNRSSWEGYWHTRIKAVQQLYQKKVILVISPNPTRQSGLQQALDLGGIAPDPSHLNEPNPTVRGYHYLTYATARLAGFVWWGGTLSGDNTQLSPFVTNGRHLSPEDYSIAIGQNDYADLYRIRLGDPITGELHQESGDGSIVYYRVFENGIVAVNPDKTSSHTLSINNPPIPVTKFFDLYELHGNYLETRREIIDVDRTGGVLNLAPLSGRVYLFAADTAYLLG
jgi:hypothetical protein